MSDISSTSWSETDASNSQFPPEGWPAGMFPNAVEPSARMNMGGVKRFWNRINPVYLASLSTTDSYVVSPSVAPAGYELYERWRVRFPQANLSTSPTLTIGGLPPQAFKKYINGVVSPLASGDIQAQDHEFWWDGSEVILDNPATNPVTISATSNSGLTINGTYVFRVDPSTLTIKASPTSSDSVLGQSAGGVFANLFSLPSLLQAYPQKGVPSTSDSVLILDSTNSNAPMIALANTLNSAIGAPFTGKFIGQSFPVPGAGVATTASHTLGARPFGVGVNLLCATSDSGYTTGDQVYFSGWSAAAGIGVQLYATATTIGLVVSNSGQINVMNKVGGSLVPITNNRWLMILEAWL